MRPTRLLGHPEYARGAVLIAVFGIRAVGLLRFKLRVLRFEAEVGSGVAVLGVRLGHSIAHRDMERLELLSHSARSGTACRPSPKAMVALPS